ncbi:MAG: four helix bundle protein [Candidatus Uhrbacteria bacterium]
MNKLPIGYGFLADQIRRASSSVALNFAEGYAKATNRDQRRFFIIARGSACEVAAILDVGFRFGVVDRLQHQQGKEICHHLACMLTKFRRA